MLKLKYATSDEAYIGVNSYLATKSAKIVKKKQGYINGDTIQVYNPVISIAKSWLNEDFDFFKHFAYTSSKWTSLVNNYVDFNHLELIKSDVLNREAKSAPTYNVTYIFSNSHGHGKGCLISLTFSRRLDSDIPHLNASMRASEVTKRLMFDLMLLDRIAKFVYGHNQTVAITLAPVMMYLQGSLTFPMFDTIIPFKKLFKGIEDDKLVSKIIIARNKFLKADPDTIAYGAHKRNAWVLQNLNPYNRKPLLIRDCTFKPFKEYPEGIISVAQRKEYDKKQKRLKKK